jgi:hypothetical protein
LVKVTGKCADGTVANAYDEAIGTHSPSIMIRALKKAKKHNK